MMESPKMYICKFSIGLSPESYDALEQKALALNSTVSGLLNCFARDLIGEEDQFEPMITLANAWFDGFLKDQEEDSSDEPSFVQWLYDSDQIYRFFCLLDSLCSDVEQLSQNRKTSRENSRDEQCLQHMNDLLLDRFCGSWAENSGTGTVKLQDFPLETQIHMRCIFDALRHLYDDYVDCENIDEDDAIFNLDFLLAFDFWQERKLRY